MSNRRKKKFSTSIFAPTAGCGGCGKPKPSDIVEPHVKPATTLPIVAGSHNPKSRLSSSSSSDQNGGLSLDDEDFSSTTKSTGIHSPVGIIIGDSIAVEKASKDPYEDFRQSMLEMIVEKRIYSTNGLQELLNCFLHLNSPNHHEIILKAFTEISNEFISHRLWICNNTGRKPPSASEGRWIREMSRAKTCEVGGIELPPRRMEEGSAWRGHDGHFI